MAIDLATKWKFELSKRNIEIESDVILARCISFAEIHTMSIDSFLNKFEAWALSHMKSNSTLILDNIAIGEFLSYELSQTKENYAKNTPLSLSAVPVSFNRAKIMALDPKNIKSKSEPTTLMIWPNNGVDLPNFRNRAQGSPPEISLPFDLSIPDKYMRIPWPRVARNINQHIEEYTKFILNGDQIEWSHPGVPSSEPIYTFGRLLSDSDHTKWNEKSIILECTRELGSGCRVPINLSNLPSFSFVSGMNVAFKGIPMIDGFYPTEIIPTIPLARPVSLIDDIPNRKFNPINLYCVAGPFALIKKSDSGICLDYTPLELFFEQISNSTIVILLGPFVDAETIAGALSSDNLVSTSTSFEETFKNEISSRLHILLQSKAPIKIVLVPSTNDIMHDFIFPQAPLPRDSLSIPNEITLLPNPLFFSINELVFAVSTADILFDMSCNEISRNQTDGDRMTRLLKLMIQQRNFYPVYPPAQNVNLDLSGSPNNYNLCNNEDGGADSPLLWKIAPDVLILPSALKHFVKVVDGILCINPGSLVSKRGHSYGSFCELHIQEFNVPQMESNLVPHFADRRSVAVIKSIS